MAKTASQRRLARRASSLAKLAQCNPERVERVLDTMLHGWVNEARYRAAAFRYQTEGEARSELSRIVTQQKMELF